MRQRLITVLLLLVMMGCVSIRHQSAVQNADRVDGEADPLAAFNHPMFTFNQNLDRWVLKPAGSAWGKVIPQAGRVSVARFFDNTGVIPRFANALFQFQFLDAGTELARFGINTTLGVGGLFDPATKWFGLHPHYNDFGLTLSKFGVGEGAYLMLPLLGPSTVRDTVGKVADAAMNPLRYLAPATTVVYASEAGAEAVIWVNYRSLNEQLFKDFDRYAIDPYSALQDGYLQRRHQREAQVGTWFGRSSSASESSN